MGDARPKRAGRDLRRSDKAPDEPVAHDSAAMNLPPASEPLEPAPAPFPEAAEPVAQEVAPPPEPMQAPAEDAWTAFAAAQTALARGFEEIAGEVSGMTRSAIAAAADAAVALLGAKTLAEIVEINAALARRGVDTALEGSARLSEIGVTAMTQASRPILSRLGNAWSGAGAV